MRFLVEKTLHPKFKREIGRDYKKGEQSRKLFDSLVDKLVMLARMYDHKNLLHLNGVNAKGVERLLLSTSREDWRGRLTRLFKENAGDRNAQDLILEVFFDLRDSYPGKTFKPRVRPGIERADKAFYVVHYTEAPAYEPAEGGYYYPTREAASSEGFDTREEAEVRAREWAEEIRDVDGREMVEIEHGYLFPSKYIGDEEYIMIEPNREYLSREAGR